MREWVGGGVVMFVWVRVCWGMLYINIYIYIFIYKGDAGNNNGIAFF